MFEFILAMVLAAFGFVGQMVCSYGPMVAGYCLAFMLLVGFCAWVVDTTQKVVAATKLVAMVARRTTAKAVAAVRSAVRTTAEIVVKHAVSLLRFGSLVCWAAVTGTVSWALHCNGIALGTTVALHCNGIATVLVAAAWWKLESRLLESRRKKRLFKRRFGKDYRGFMDPNNHLEPQTWQDRWAKRLRKGHPIYTDRTRATQSKWESVYGSQSKTRDNYSRISFDAHNVVRYTDSKTTFEKKEHSDWIQELMQKATWDGDYGAKAVEVAAAGGIMQAYSSTPTQRREDFDDVNAFYRGFYSLKLPNTTDMAESTGFWSVINNSLHKVFGAFMAMVSPAITVVSTAITTLPSIIATSIKDMVSPAITVVSTAITTLPSIIATSIKDFIFGAVTALGRQVSPVFAGIFVFDSDEFVVAWAIAVGLLMIAFLATIRFWEDWWVYSTSKATGLVKYSKKRKGKGKRTTIPMATTSKPSTSRRHQPTVPTVTIPKPLDQPTMPTVTISKPPNAPRKKKLQPAMATTAATISTPFAPRKKRFQPKMTATTTSKCSNYFLFKPTPPTATVRVPTMAAAPQPPTLQRRGSSLVEGPVTIPQQELIHEEVRRSKDGSPCSSACNCCFNHWCIPVAFAEPKPLALAMMHALGINPATPVIPDVRPPLANNPPRRRRKIIRRTFPEGGIRYGTVSGKNRKLDDCNEVPSAKKSCGKAPSYSFEKMVKPGPFSFI